MRLVTPKAIAAGKPASTSPDSNVCSSSRIWTNSETPYAPQAAICSTANEPKDFNVRGVGEDTGRNAPQG